MSSKTIIYGKQSGEALVPLTIRIEWLPDGVIRPMMYWTPDGTYFEVKHVYEMMPLAFLKDRGEGIRFKVRAEIIEAPEYNDAALRTIHETYLYLADNRFCGRNFIDSRYGHAGKEFIPVTLDIFPDGDYELIYFEAQGARYSVEKVIEIEPRGSFHAGGVGIRHKVEACLVNTRDTAGFDANKSVSRMAAVYFEINKWFVSVKTV